jgi:hypothetical protein
MSRAEIIPPLRILKPRLRPAERLAAESPGPVVLEEKKRGNIAGNSITDGSKNTIIHGGGKC